MDLQSFKDTLSGIEPPASADLALQAMWYEAKGDWEQAHNLAQQKNNQVGAWVHAYLHRQEGDKWNANYWYNKAGRTMPDQSLQEEWDDIVATLLAGI